MGLASPPQGPAGQRVAAMSSQEGILGTLLMLLPLGEGVDVVRVSGVLAVLELAV